MTQIPTEPPLYVPEPMTTTADKASTYRLTRDFASSSSSSSSQALVVRCTGWLVRARGWVSRYRYEIAPAAGTSTLSLLGWWQESIGATVSYGLLTGVAGAAAVLGLKYKNAPVTQAAAGFTVALGDIATATAFGPGPESATAWALTTGLAYWIYGPWLTAQRNARMKLHIDTVKAKGALPNALGLEAADPGLIGATPEETALRRAIHALTGAAPLDVMAFHRGEHGWSALVVMPAGRSTAPSAIISRRVQLAANLGQPGKLTLAQGPADNELVVKVSTVDALAGTLPLTETGVTTCREPVLLGADEDGQPIHLTLMYRHTLIAGASDWGKSGIVNLLIKRLNRCLDADLYGIDMKPGAPELGPWEPVMAAPVAKTPTQARALLLWLRDECNRRGAIIAELSRKSMAEGKGPVRKWVPGVHGKAIFVFTDELAELVRQDPGLAELYESLLAIARFLAIHFISATQQPSRKVFGGSTDARGNYANRLSTRAGEAGHAPFVFGQGCQAKGWRPELLDLPGKFLLQTAELTEPKVYRAEYVTDLDIAADVGFYYSDKADTEPQPALTDEPWVEQFALLRFPNGDLVRPGQWPDLWEQFQALGSATKKELAAVCQISRDTAMRAIEEWEKHGVVGRRDGRSTRYYAKPEEEQ
ncbi:FtsK/SpoIIIE family protein [Streptomyces sp. Ag109_O5-1]|uniref:FtsK/SpoIIIE domain-containing protein n=1 Tax=Streptomyces sp. Ag109_O5-1 TaxID=1938851 RepID=UPI000F4F8729|nr:FtsK/SpoIIIE domain-containing protein [Streptomyces sp. Ag109_O5-1]RPE39776.1 FtsK/SpoIIIE family protein [Streptomyces sp. Ag109_O5-1]